MKMNHWKKRILAFWIAVPMLFSGTTALSASPLYFSMDRTSLEFGSLLTDRNASVYDSGGILAATRGSSVSGTLEWQDQSVARRPLYTSGAARLRYIPRTGSDVLGTVSYTVNAPTATTMRNAVNALSATDTIGISGVASGLSRLASAEKRRMASATVRKLGEYYNKVFGVSSSGKDSVKVYSDVTSSKTISASNSYAFGVSASRGTASSLHVNQKATTGSALLNLDLSGFSGPVLVYLAVPSGVGISSSYDYYMRAPSENRNVSITGSSPRYIYFLAPESGNYKLYKGSASSSSKDDDETTSEFWEDVMREVRNAKSGDRVRVSMGSRTQMPADVLRTLRSRSVTLILKDRDGNTVSIYGKDVPKIPENRDVYTFKTLRNLYGNTSSSSKPSTGSSSSSPAASSSVPNAGVPDQWIFEAPPTVSPRPAVPLPVIPSVSSKPTVSVPPVSTDEDMFEGEDEVFEPRQSSEEEMIKEPVEEESSSDAEQLLAQEPDEENILASSRADPVKLFTFLGLVTFTAALGGGLLTYLVISRHKRR